MFHHMGDFRSQTNIGRLWTKDPSPSRSDKYHGTYRNSHVVRNMYCTYTHTTYIYIINIYIYIEMAIVSLSDVPLKSVTRVLVLHPFANVSHHGRPQLWSIHFLTAGPHHQGIGGGFWPCGELTDVMTYKWAISGISHDIPWKLLEHTNRTQVFKLSSFGIIWPLFLQHYYLALPVRKLGIPFLMPKDPTSHRLSKVFRKLKRFGSNLEATEVLKVTGYHKKNEESLYAAKIRNVSHKMPWVWEVHHLSWRCIRLYLFARSATRRHKAPQSATKRHKAPRAYNISHDYIIELPWKWSTCILGGSWWFENRKSYQLQ